MVYGPVTTHRKLPEQNFETILLFADRYDRASQAQAKWAAPAKTCVEFVEGKQWSATDLQTLEDESRPGFTFNKVAPLVRLVMGYHRNNRTDEKFLPGQDDTATENVAVAITKTAKQISEASQQPYVDAEVFGDGIMTGRGFYDWRLNFEDNELGEASCSAQDPFATLLDPDGDQYDLNKSNYVMNSRWGSLNDIEATYGLAAMRVTEPLLSGGGYTGLPAAMADYAEQITPWRRFGGNEEDQNYTNYGSMHGFMNHLIDPVRKSIRILDMQHYVRVKTRMIIDLDTGLKKHLPDHWKMEKIRRFLTWQEEKYASLGKVSPIRFDERMQRRTRWTTMVGDFLVYDDWSPYSTFTIVPYFPYFRRGMTRGMVEDLLDPQREVNKRRSSRIDQTTRGANGGWQVHESAVNDEQEENLEVNGSSPGFIFKWKGDHEPKQIQSPTPPIAHERLEAQAADDMNEISGVNRDLMGGDEKVKSGKAIEARQRAGVVSIQTYMDNMSRTKELVGRKKLELIQEHYTEQRLIRIQGDDGKQDSLIINQRTANEIINNVSIGRYGLSIDETPLSASFAAGQFEELMDMIEKGVLPIEAVMDIAVDMSSIPQKEAVKKRVIQVMASKGIIVGDEAGMGQPMAPAMPGQELIPQ